MGHECTVPHDQPGGHQSSPGLPVCPVIDSSVIAEAAGPSEAPEAGPARTYGAYSPPGQPQSQTDIQRSFPGYPMRWKPSHRPLAIGSGPAGVLPPLPEIGHHQNCRSTRQSSVISGSAGRLIGTCHRRHCRVGRVGTVSRVRGSLPGYLLPQSCRQSKW